MNKRKSVNLLKAGDEPIRHEWTTRRLVAMELIDRMKKILGSYPTEYVMLEVAERALMSITLPKHQRRPRGGNR